MAQNKPSGKPIKITLTEAQISDIIQRAAKTRRSIRVESLEDRIAPSRIGLPIFGGAEDVDKLDETVSGDAPLDGVQFGDEPIFGGDAPITEGDGLQGDGGLVDPFGGGDDNLVDPNDGLGDGIVDPNNPGDGILDPNSLPQELGGDDVEPNGLVGDGPEETVEGNPTVDEAANVEFNENLHLQGDAPDSGLTAEEMEEHRLNILRQLRG